MPVLADPGAAVVALTAAGAPLEGAGLGAALALVALGLAVAGRLAERALDDDGAV